MTELSAAMVTALEILDEAPRAKLGADRTVKGVNAIRRPTAYRLRELGLVTIDEELGAVEISKSGRLALALHLAVKHT